MSATATIALIILVASVKGQMDTDIMQTNYEYQSGQFLENDDDAFLKDYIPVRSKAEQMFLQGLIIEAGRHVLFPQLYESKKVKQVKDDDIENVAKVEFFELKGQPELEQSYTNSKRAGCPRHCPIYKPVCGNDGKVYESECHMQQENCGSSSVTVGNWQRCQGKHYLCPSRCLDLNDPVCGSDGKIYRNICLLRKKNCGKLLEALPVVKCYENTRQSKSMDECPGECQDLYKPVCGSDGIIYYNECFMRKKSCNQGIVEVMMESCTEDQKCPEVCLPIYDPVCGSDRRIYINVCRMLQETCGREVKAVARSFCRSDKEISQGRFEELQN